MGPALRFRVELEREADGRWIAEVTELPGALAYGDTRDEAIQAVATLVYRIIADRVEHREMAPPNTVSFEHAA